MRELCARPWRRWGSAERAGPAREGGGTEPRAGGRPSPGRAAGGEERAGPAAGSRSAPSGRGAAGGAACSGRAPAGPAGIAPGRRRPCGAGRAGPGGGAALGRGWRWLRSWRALLGLSDTSASIPQRVGDSRSVRDFPSRPGRRKMLRVGREGYYSPKLNLARSLVGRTAVKHSVRKPSEMRCSVLFRNLSTYISFFGEHCPRCVCRAAVWINLVTPLHCGPGERFLFLLSRGLFISHL